MAGVDPGGVAWCADHWPEVFDEWAARVFERQEAQAEGAVRAKLRADLAAAGFGKG